MRLLRPTTILAPACPNNPPVDKSDHTSNFISCFDRPIFQAIVCQPHLSGAREGEKVVKMSVWPGDFEVTLGTLRTSASLAKAHDVKKSVPTLTPESQFGRSVVCQYTFPILKNPRLTSSGPLNLKNKD
ncbi:hypothetical protein BaRGS_00013708, partial [Batillaria attramentaria]